MTRKIDYRKIDFRSFVSKNYHSFDEIKILSDVKSIDVSSNPIKNFNGIQQFPKLINLKMDNTQLESLENANLLVSLNQFSCLNTPLAKKVKQNLLQIMCLVVFGQSIRVINGKCVTEENREKAKKVAEKIKPQLTRGYLLVSYEPLAISRPGSKDFIEVDIDGVEFLNKESEILQNEQKLVEMRKKLQELMNEKKKEQEKLRKSPISNKYQNQYTPIRSRSTKKLPQTEPRKSKPEENNESLKYPSSERKSKEIESDNQDLNRTFDEPTQIDVSGNEVKTVTENISLENELALIIEDDITNIENEIVDNNDEHHQENKQIDPDFQNIIQEEEDEINPSEIFDFNDDETPPTGPLIPPTNNEEDENDSLLNE